MQQHHKESIKNLVEEFEKDKKVLALILGGSIAHGFDKPDSDIDVSIVINNEEYQKLKKRNKLHYYNREMCTYENGYIDGKYATLDFLKSVAFKGSDPARYAFKDNKILFSRIDDLEKILSDIVRYPINKKEDRIHRFATQLFAWRWYYSEAIRLQNQYLAILALQKIILFSSRIVFVINELFYPYHKWMLKVLQTAKNKPDKMLPNIHDLLKDHTKEKADSYCKSIFDFAGIDEKETDQVWPTQFIMDTELKWLSGEPYIDDL